MLAPTVSIVMPTFNRLEHLEAAIASVHAQTFDDWELIVVDDGSDEPTREFLRSMPQRRTTVVLCPHSGVPGAVRNRGIALARGRYIAFLDSDDQWAPQKLQRQVALMESAGDRRWSYTAVRRIDADGREILSRSVPWFAHSGQVLEQVLRVDAQIATPTVMAELAFIRELGGFDETMRFVEDYDLWSRMALRSEVAVDTEPSAFVRSHDQHFTSDRIGNLGGWVGLYAKMEALVPSARLRVLCRKRRREYLLKLAAQQARVCDWVGVRETLRAAARSRACSPRGWWRVARMALLGLHDHP